MSDSKKTIVLTDQEISKVENEPGIAIIDFWAEWCGPCKTLSPTLETIATEFTGKVKVFTLDVDANPETAQKFQIRSIPTVLLFKGGKLVDRMVGNQPKNNFVAAINKALA